MKFATLGYGMTNKTTKKKSEIFKQVLLQSGIKTLIDIRYNVWGGYWNPKKISEILTNTSIRYFYDEPDFCWHKSFGVKKEGSLWIPGA